MRLGKEGKAVEAKARVKRRYADLIREHTRFWLVEPKLGLMETRNLGTLVTGSYIAVEPGKGHHAHRFRVAPEPPKAATGRRLNVVLKADRLGSIKVGDKVFFRGIAVGKVAGAALAHDSASVRIDTLIEHRYAPLVRKNSRFWRISGISVDLGLFSGAKIHTGSLETIMQGGIAFATPGAIDASGHGKEEMQEQQMLGDIPVAVVKSKRAHKGRPGKRVKSGAEFDLFDEAQDEWHQWKPKIKL